MKRLVIILALTVPLLAQVNFEPAVRKNIQAQKLNNKRMCDQFSTAGASTTTKIGACLTNLPSTGGIADNSGFEGSHTITSDVFSGVTKNVHFVIGAATLASNVNIVVPANVTLDFSQGGVLSPAVGTTLTINGPIIGPISQHFAGAGTVLIGRKVAQVYPQWWGALTSASVQSAVTSLVPTGGTVFFTRDAWVWTTTVTVSSIYPINLIGEMSGALGDPAQSTYGFILSGNIAGPMVLYTAPNAGTRGYESGGGVIRGLTVTDLLNRNYTTTAAFELHDFPLSRFTDNIIQYVKGRAILGEYLVQSEISGNVIRYSGDTSKPAVDLPNTSGTYPSQSLLISGNRLEVNYSDTYLKVGLGGGNNNSILIRNNRFEADTATAATNGQFLEFAANAGSIIGNAFNRNTGIQFTLSGAYNIASLNVFTGGAYTTTAWVISGIENNCTGNMHAASNRTGLEVDITGADNIYNGNKLYFSGSIRTGTVNSNSVSDNSLSRLTSTTAVLGAGEDFWINARGTASETINGNNLTNSAPNITTVGGIRLVGSYQTAIGNAIKTFTGSGSGAIGISSEGIFSTILGNNLLDAPIVVTGNGTGAAYGPNYTNSGSIPMENSKAYNPGSILDGGIETTTITITGTAVGDFAEAQFSQQAAGVFLDVYTFTNTVSITFHNESGSTVDLPSGTLKARVRKW